MVSGISRRSILKGAAGAVAVAAASKASTTFAAPAVIQSGPIEITYWGSFSGALGEAEKTITDNFNAAQTDIKLNYQFQGTYEETAQKLTTALQAKQAPDVSLLSDVWWFKFYLAGALAPLNDLISANQLDTTDYVDSLINEGNRNGQQYWIPFARSTPLFYYNKDVFTAAGLTAAPKTWDEFVAATPDLMGDNRSAFAHPSAASYVAWLFQPVVWQYGGAFSDADFNILINKPEAVAAGEFYKSSVADGWATTPDDPEADFESGLTAAILASTGGLRGITDTAEFEVGTGFLPEGPAGFGCCTGGAGMAVLAASAPEKQEAGFKFIEWMTAPEQTEWWSQNTGYMPVRKSAVESETMQAFFTDNPNFKTAVDQLAQTKPQDAARVFIPNGDQIIGKGLERILIDQEEVQSVFDDVAATLTEDGQPVLEQVQSLEG
jgi:sn-glycerol 3-phosphate transport system substrate-binding protein